ncbi:phage portal protein [Kitasatospora kazusensis]|uniref:phage portal protein n=1 Tax=Kitasatospora kazusensis TaxID=407974 RepID=UPI0031DBA1D1
MTTTGESVAVHRGWPLAGLNDSVQVTGSKMVALAFAPGGTPNYATFSRIYKSNPWVYAAVQAISWGLSRMPLHVYQLDSQGNRRRVRGDLPGVTGRPNTGQALDSLMRLPEPGVARAEWVRKVMVSRMVYGNALCQQERPGNTGMPNALWYIPWRRVQVITGEDVPILGYRVTGSKGERIFAVDETVHFGRNGDLDSPIGVSPIEPLHFTVALHDALWRHLNAYFQNAARPSGILTVDKGTSKESQERIQEQIRRLYASPDQAGKIMVTSGTWQALSADPQSANITELLRLSREEVAAAYQVPPPILGHLERAIHANVTELRSQFIRDVLGPHASALEGDLNAQLIAMNPAWTAAGYFVGFDMNEAIRPDLSARALVYEKMRHVWSPNYMRQLEGLEPLTGEAGLYADTLWMPSGEIPLGLPQPQMQGAAQPGQDDPADGKPGEEQAEDDNLPAPGIEGGESDADTGTEMP